MKPFVLAAVIIFAAACEDRRPAPEPDRSAEQLSRIANDSVAAVAAETAPALVQPDTAGASGAVGLAFQALTDSKVRGSGTVAPQGDATQLILNIQDAAPNARLRAVVSAAPCPGSGNPIAVIDPIVTGPEGDAESVSRLTTPPQEVLDGRHSVRVEVRTERGLDPVTCANIAAADRLPPPRP